MPFDTCVCCKNRFGLDERELVMIHEGLMGQGKHNGGHPVETRIELDFEKAVHLVNLLMDKFNISAGDLERTL